MTEKEERAMLIWQLREWGIHPTWVEYLLNQKDIAKGVDAHAEKYGDRAAENIVGYLKRPMVE